MEEMISKVREWLHTQGFTLEMQASSAFRAAGFEVRQADHYIDPETGKGREIDVVATHPDDLGVVDIKFVVECKSSRTPWVLLCSPDTLYNYNRLFALGALSEKARDFLGDRVAELIPKLHWLRKDGLIGYSARQALSQSDAAYSAAISAAKACDYSIHKPQGQYVAPYSLAFPVIVVDAPILRCSLDLDGQIEIESVEEGEFLFLARLPRYSGSCIRLVTANRVHAFAREAKQVADLFRAEFKSVEEREGES